MAISKKSRQLLVLSIYVAVIGIGLIFKDVFVPPAINVYHSISGVIKKIDGTPVTNDSEKDNSKEDKVQLFSDEEARELVALSMLVMEKYRVDAKLAANIVVHSHLEAKKQKLPVTLVLAVMAQESSFRPDAISHNDHGLMQVNSIYHSKLIAEVGGKSKLYEPKVNIQVGTTILAGYYKQGGSYWSALRKYNGQFKSNDYPDNVLAKMYVFDQKLAEM